MTTDRVRSATLGIANPIGSLRNLTVPPDAAFLAVMSAATSTGERGSTGCGTRIFFCGWKFIAHYHYSMFAMRYDFVEPEPGIKPFLAPPPHDTSACQLNNDLYSLNSFNASRSALDKCHQELDIRYLLQAHAIGVATPGLARCMDVLRLVRAKVIICEEVLEVLEAHGLTMHLPGVEHDILIGDHEQLRPHINNYELQRDSSRC